tara:strand:- start:1167 stop:1646 length:480 start_codon:yes stop_codon:yes gene_type:complete
MLKKLLLLFYLLIGFNAFSQEKIEFDFSPSALDEARLEEEAFIKNHYLGLKIARKVKLVDLAYKWIDPPTPTRISAVVKIEKQPIYFALKKLITPKFYKNKIKNEGLSKEDAVNELSNILDIALMIRYQETEKLEKLLRSANAEGVLDIFNNQINIKSY